MKELLVVDNGQVETGEGSTGTTVAVAEESSSPVSIKDRPVEEVESAQAGTPATATCSTVVGPPNKAATKDVPLRKDINNNNKSSSHCKEDTRKREAKRVEDNNNVNNNNNITNNKNNADEDAKESLPPEPIQGTSQATSTTSTSTSKNSMWESSPSRRNIAAAATALATSVMNSTTTTGTAKSSRGKRNSLALRKNIPVNFSLGLTHSSFHSSDLCDDLRELEAFAEGSSSLSSHNSKKGSGTGGGGGDRASRSGGSGPHNTEKVSTPVKRQRPGLLRTSCLNPKFSLRTQLMLSFGFVSVIIISLVMIACIVVTILSGQKVKDITSDTFDNLVTNIDGTTVRYIAEFLTYRLIPSDLVQILWESARDRMAGYPDAPGFAEDAHVPFWDVQSQSNRYPIVAPPLPLDWQIHEYANVNQENFHEHVQDRWSWYRSLENDDGNNHDKDKPCLSTQRAVYFMQGMCNPEAMTDDDPAYYPNCTDANNDLRTGGVVAPTDTNELLHRKSSDLSPLLKALYEYHHDVKALGIAFANSGAGSTVQFPHYDLHSQNTYASQGCEWMRQSNPIAPERTIGNEEMISRCHPAGAVVSYREYNPMDEQWCQKQALEPDKVHIAGPHLDDASRHGIEANRWIMTIGRAIYDRVTNEFIGCIRVNVVLDFLESVLRDACVTENSHITVVRWDDHGTVVASSARSMASSNRTVTVDQLNVGMTKKNYLELKNLVNYNIPWDPEELRELYETSVTKKDGFLIGAYPVPPPPEVYDPDYRPEFFAVKSISKEDVFEQLYLSRGKVDETVDELVHLCLFIGLIGILVVLGIIVMVSNSLTNPLRFMSTVATDIVNNYVDNSEDGIMFTQPKYAPWCTLKTEVIDVVSEFRKMVSRFSGTSNAKTMKGNYTDIKNRFDLCSKFDVLYRSRQEQDFKFKVKESAAQTSQALGDAGEGIESNFPTRKHHGSLLVKEDGKHRVSPVQEVDGISSSLERAPSVSSMKAPSESSVSLSSQKKTRYFVSPLFFWIVFLIATPLIMTTIALSAIMTYRVSNEFPELVNDAKTDFVNIELFALQVYVVLRASFVSEVTSRSTRDLHLLTRYASWLLFDGINRTDSFTEVATGAEACKTFQDVSECPFAKETACDCAWNELTPDFCHDYRTDSRYLQKLIYVAESLDTMVDGDRNSTSYPRVAYSPNTTGWWDDVSSVPGSEEGSNASGYDTTYDRLRVMSALPVSQILYNYDLKKKYAEGAFIAMEDDGLFIGFFGCNSMAYVSTWQSSEENGAGALRPELCPYGKYGYDARCRQWYNTGRELYIENGTSHYLTSPYMFSEGTTFAQSATASLVDPKTKRHVGQALVDFRSTAIFDALNSENTPLVLDGFHVLITPLQDNFGGDTVIGPGFSNDGAVLPIEDVVLPSESCPEQQCVGHSEFRDAVLKMKNGERGLSMFPMTRSDGSVESMHIAYAPVRVEALSAKDSSDFSRGVDGTNQMIYSLALAESEEGILAPFEAIEEDIDRQMKIVLSILCSAIVLSTILVLYISSRVAASITKPMLYLLELIRHINRISADDMTSSSPEVDRDFGCREVRHVATTMEVLYKVVRDANMAFFAGNIETAYAVLTDTLRLFQRLDNKKAIGVGNNNLGNMMLAMYRTMQTTNVDRVCGFTQREIVQKGVAYFHQAIKLGEAAYDDFYEKEGWSPNCLEFMQHLSNRYFNRAMFLLTVKNSHKNPKELEELGFRDLQIVTDMDVEIVDEGTQVGWNVRTAEQLFDVKLRRIKGHLQLLEMGYEDVWDVDELLEDAFKILETELKKPSSKLFAELFQAGRIQQVETEMMRYLVLKKDLKTAAKIAIRMLCEDEYTLPDAQRKAVEVLLAYLKSEESGAVDRDVLQELINYSIWLSAIGEENDLRISTRDGPALDEVSEVFQLSTAKHSGTCSIKSCDRHARLSSLRESKRGDFTMEVF